MESTKLKDLADSKLKELLETDAHIDISLFYARLDAIRVAYQRVGLVA